LNAENGEYGDSTIALVDGLLGKSTNHVVALMRHSAREFEPGRHDLLNPLTEDGRRLAIRLGRRLAKSATLRG